MQFKTEYEIKNGKKQKKAEQKKEENKTPSPVIAGEEKKQIKSE